MQCAPLHDGTKKVIINAEAFRKAEDKDLKGFLEYVKTGTVNMEYTGRIEAMIQTVKKVNRRGRNTALCRGLKWTRGKRVLSPAPIKQNLKRQRLLNDLVLILLK